MPKIKVITRKEFSHLLNIKPATVRSLISRGQIKESQQGCINVFNTTNQDWIVDHCNRNSINIKPIFESNGKPLIPKPKPSKQAKEVINVLKTEPEPEIIKAESNYTRLRDEKLKEEVEKIEYEKKLKKFELERKKAKHVPVDFIIQMFGIYFKGNITDILNSVNKSIDKLVDELEGNYQTKLAYKKELKVNINKVINDNHEKLSKEIIEKAKEYALSTKW